MSDASRPASASVGPVGATSGPVPYRLKVYNAIGAIAFGIKENGFTVFLLMFYNQVLGMDPWIVSLALVTALVCDALIDPFLGALTDRTYTRWGRRLPWLYAAPVPLAIAWYFLWAPPFDGPPTYGSLVLVAVIVRLLMSACEVPSISLVPEITRDYDERTTLFRYRYLFGWAAGIVSAFLAYQVFLRGNLLGPEGFRNFGIYGAITMAVAVLVSALAQHRYVAGYPNERPPRFSLRETVDHIREAFSERAFLIFAAGALAAYVSQGMTFALMNYLFYFVWQLTEAQLAFYPFVLLISVVTVFFSLSTLHRRFGKARTGSVATLVAMTFWLIPYALYYLGQWPELGSAASTYTLFGFVLVSNAGAVTAIISATSMVAEVVEAYQERTGKRAEGSFYAGNWLVQKSASGCGILLAGGMLSFVAFPAAAVPGEIPTPIIVQLIELYASLVFALGLTSAYWLARFPISREEHEARLAALDAAASAAPDDGGKII